MPRKKPSATIERSPFMAPTVATSGEYGKAGDRLLLVHAATLAA
jgi:hypothetical protein